MAAPAAGFKFLLRRSQLLIAPVSSLHGCEESRQTPIRIKRAAMLLPVALAALPPQKNVGAAAASNRIPHRPVAARSSGANPWLARVAGDPF